MRGGQQHLFSERQRRVLRSPLITGWKLKPRSRCWRRLPFIDRIGFDFKIAPDFMEKCAGVLRRKSKPEAEQVLASTPSNAQAPVRL